MITVDARCHCESCKRRTEDIYRMVGACVNCHTEDILLIFRAGDRACSRDCPVCGCYSCVQPQRLATADEVPAT